VITIVLRKSIQQIIQRVKINLSTQKSVSIREGTYKMKFLEQMSQFHLLNKFWQGVMIEGAIEN
jgi:hypothetical protein